MRIVVDSNRVLAAMIKEGTTRGLLFDDFFEFVAPDFIESELNRYKERVCQAANISEEQFKTVLSLILEHITIISKQDYQNSIEALKGETSDEKDIPYFAVCLVTNAQGIWTHDAGFRKQEKVKIFTNIDLLRFSGVAQK